GRQPRRHAGHSREADWRSLVSFPDVLRQSYRFFSASHPVRVHSIRRGWFAGSCKRTQEIAMTSYRNGPDAKGLFGSFGGQYVAETLMPRIHELAAEYEKAKQGPEFATVLAYCQRDYVGRPSPLYFAERLTEHCGGAKIYLKR